MARQTRVARSGRLSYASHGGVPSLAKPAHFSGQNPGGACCRHVAQIVLANSQPANVQELGWGQRAAFSLQPTHLPRLSSLLIRHPEPPLQPQPEQKC